MPIEATENIGTRKPAPLRTAVETAAVLFPSAPPEAIAPVLPLAGLLLVPLAEIEALARCNGGNVNSAKHSLRATAARQLERLRIVSPESFDEVQTHLKNGQSALQAAWLKIREQTEAVGDLENKSTELGIIRRTIAEDASRLAGSRNELESPGVLGLSADALTQLENFRKHLPTVITGNQERVERLKAEITDTVRGAKIDLRAVVERLHTESPPGGSTRALINSGYMDDLKG